MIDTGVLLISSAVLLFSALLVTGLLALNRLRYRGTNGGRFKNGLRHNGTRNDYADQDAEGIEFPDPDFELQTQSRKKNQAGFGPDSIDGKTEGAVTTERLLFTVSSSSIEPSMLNNLRELAAHMQKNEHIHARIFGSADSLGSRSTNVQLARRRAAAVLSALVHHGVPAARLTLGPIQVQTGHNEAERGRLRSVTIQLRDQV